MLVGPKFFRKMPKICPKKKTILKTCSDFYFYFPELGIMGKDEKIRAFQKTQHLFKKWNAP
jgi:hypothetical protein